MPNYKTKLFGELKIDKLSNYFDLEYKGQYINIFFYEPEQFEDKMNQCIALLDKYIEIDCLARKALISNFSKEKTIKDYFEFHFFSFDEDELKEIFGTKHFEKLKVAKTIKKLKYPEFIFSLEKNNEILLTVGYKVAEDYSDEILCVLFDQYLNVVDFSHES